MQTFLILLHVFLCLFLILMILIQPGKSPGMGGAFGGASGSASFGAKSPVTILVKITVFLAAGFMISSLTLAWMSVRDHSVRIDLGEDTHYPTPGLSLPSQEITPEDVTGTGVDHSEQGVDSSETIPVQDATDAPVVDDAGDASELEPVPDEP